MSQGKKVGRFVESRTDLSMRVDLESGQGDGEGGKKEEEGVEEGRMKGANKRLVVMSLGCGVVVAIVLALAITVGKKRE